MRSFLHGAVQLHVLHHAAEHPIHGAWMAAELARHGYQVSPGTLYPLHRLEAAGLLSGHDDLKQAGECAATPSPTPAASPWPKHAAPCANSATNSCSRPLPSAGDRLPSSATASRSARARSRAGGVGVQGLGLPAGKVAQLLGQLGTITRVGWPRRWHGRHAVAADLPPPSSAAQAEPVVAG